MNLNTTRVCSLPSYPGVDGRGPVVLSYLADQRVLAACGSLNNTDDQSCYQLSPDQPSGWQPLGAGQHFNQFCARPQYTRSHPLQAGWFLIGQKDNCGSSGAALSTELLTPELQWITPSISNPFDKAGYPWGTCSVAINSSSVIVTGGLNNLYLSSTWMLDLSDFSWTRLQDLPGPRFAHGCTTTATGELIIVGGWDGSDISSVYIYNLINNTWRRAGDLPAGMNYYYFPVMFLWNKHPILLEPLTSNIWILDGNNWTLMEATMGAQFGGLYDTATTVPAGIFTC